MKTLINTRNIVNFKVQTFLFAFSVIMHAAATFVAVSHPLLGWLLAMLETVGWTSILVIWMIALIKCIRHGGLKLWARLRRDARTHMQRKKAKGTDLVSIEQLKHMQNNVQRLGLALHDLTPETENARRLHFQMCGEVVPPLVLPPQNAALYAEFEGLVRMLNHFGFPNLERVRLHQKDFAFIQQWGSDLETRLQQAQKTYAYQQQVMQWLLDEACKTLETLGSHYPQAQDDAGYQRIRGALKLLKKVAHKSHRPEEVTGYLTALLQDMESLREQLKQVAA